MMEVGSDMVCCCDITTKSRGERSENWHDILVDLMRESVKEDSEETSKES